MNISICKEYVNGTNTSPVLFIETIYAEEKISQTRNWKETD